MGRFVNFRPPMICGIVVDHPRLNRGICLVLAVMKIAVYADVRYFDFVNVSQNPPIQAGFTAETLKWAFTSGGESSRFPLSRLSHMLDWKLYGGNAGGNHLTSVFLHMLSSLLLFGFRLRVTGDTAPTAFVAFTSRFILCKSSLWRGWQKGKMCFARGSGSSR